MKKIKAFIYVYKKSLTSFSYYRDVLKAGLGFSVKYYLFLALLASIVTSIGIDIRVIPETSKVFENLVNTARNAFPSDLVFEVKEGKWTVNRPEPFIVPLPEIGEKEADVKTPKNLIVFYNNGTIEDLQNLDTLVLFNSVNVLYREENKISVVPLKDLPDTKFDKAEFDKLMTTVGSIFKLFPLMMVLMIFLGVLIANTIVKAIYFAWFSLLVWLASIIAGVKLSYNESVRVAIHSSTLPITLGILFNYVNFIPFQMWFVTLNLLFAIFVLIDMAKFNKSQAK